MAILQRPKVTAMDLFKQERERQIEKGYDKEHDDKVGPGRLRMAALAYAHNYSEYWPEGMDSKYKPGSGAVKSLIRGGALLLASKECAERIDDEASVELSREAMKKAAELLDSIMKDVLELQS